MRSLEGVRQRSVYVIQSLLGDVSGSANDRLCRLLFFIGAFKDAGARQVTACVTCLDYARKERRTHVQAQGGSMSRSRLAPSVPRRIDCSLRTDRTRCSLRIRSRDHWCFTPI